MRLSKRHMKKIVNRLIIFSVLFVLAGCATVTDNVSKEETVDSESVLEVVQSDDKLSAEPNAGNLEGQDEKKAEETTDEAVQNREENTGLPKRVIALSKSNAEVWLQAGGELIATSDDAMELDGLSEEAVSLGDMDHVSLEAITALSPDLLILFSTDPAQKALGEAAEDVGIPVYYMNIDNFGDY